MTGNKHRGSDYSNQLPLPNGSRADIMLRKCSLEQLHQFKNKELEKRYKHGSFFDFTVIGTATATAMGSGIILRIVWLFDGQGSLGLSVVAGLVAFCTTAMIIAGIIIHKRRQRLYARASEIVLHKEPCTRMIRLVYGYKGAQFLSLKNTDDSKDRLWRLGNQSVIDEVPQIREGMTAEVYIDPTSGQPLGMFTGDKVAWFI